MPTIQLVAFRGVGGVFNDDHPLHSESALIRAGHVALGNIIGDKLIGFSPTEQALQNAGSENALLEQLKHYVAQEGKLQDDTAIFHRAQALAETGERCTVWQLNIDISEEVLETIRQWYNKDKRALYNFPDENGQFETDEYNCATFPQRLGVTIPADTGYVKDYVRAMRLQGATKWQG